MRLTEATRECARCNRLFEHDGINHLFCSDRCWHAYIAHGPINRYEQRCSELLRVGSKIPDGIDRPTVPSDRKPRAPLSEEERDALALPRRRPPRKPRAPKPKDPPVPPAPEGRTVTMIPAYGRDYKSAWSVWTDWRALKDFQVADYSEGRNDGRYANADSFLVANAANPMDKPVVAVRIRYSRLRKVVRLPVDVEGT